MTGPARLKSLLSAGMAIVVFCTCAQMAWAAETPQAQNMDSFPKWSEFPLAPKNVPTPAEFAQRIAVQDSRTQSLNAEVAALVWDKFTIADITAQVKKQIKPDMMKPVDKAMSPAEIDAMVAGLRKRATPPPVVH